LIAESTGKEGKGIVPVIGEPLGAPEAYGDDRLFVSIRVGGAASADSEVARKLKALEQAGHPVVYRNLEDLHELGAEFFLWEMATAFAGWRLGINPFDQPNVQESKDATKALLEKYISEGRLPEPQPVATDGPLTIYLDGAAGGSTFVRDLLQQYIAKARRGDYVALLAYLEETPEIESSLQVLRLSLQTATGCATTTGYGPRFLHSTGQLHKGGPDNAVFFQITAPDQADFEVPGAPYSFSTLKQAQAQGDFQSLLAHGRRAIRVDLGNDVADGLRRLREVVTDGA
jgi:transaldolase/glucose-6-phosphate isomerase